MTPRHLKVAMWICAIAAVVAVVPFLTGKNKLADFFSPGNHYQAVSSSPRTLRRVDDSEATKKSEGAQITTAETTLDQLLDLATSNKMTGLQAEQLTKALDGKTVILIGYLIDSRRSFLGSSADISSSETGGRTFYLNIDRSDKDNWAIPKGSYIRVQTTLKQPQIGTMVGNNAKLLQIGKGGEQADSPNQ